MIETETPDISQLRDNIRLAQASYEACPSYNAALQLQQRTDELNRRYEARRAKFIVISNPTELTSVDTNTSAKYVNV